MPVVPGIPGKPQGGLRQERAARLRAEAEAAQRQSQPAAAAPPAQTELQQQDQGTGAVGQGDYVVKQGDCISSIAEETGHFWDTIWNDPANAELRNVRKTPNILLPGDRVTVPEVHPKKESGETEMRHRFVRRGMPALFRLQLFVNGDPRANQEYTLSVDDTLSFQGFTDSMGVLQEHIPAGAKHGLLTIGPSAYTLEIDFGHLSPAESLEGVQQRLQNLGFDCGAAGGELNDQTTEALRGFQARFGLAVTGEPDAATRKKLEELHDDVCDLPTETNPGEDRGANRL